MEQVPNPHHPRIGGPDAPGDAYAPDGGQHRDNHPGGEGQQNPGARRSWADFPKQPQDPQGRDNLNQAPGATLVWIYALIRELKPDRIIETGTAAGSSASIVLAALHANNCGELVSIDLPAEKGKRGMGWSLPEGEQAGFLIPDEYRRRWDLRVGDAKDLRVPAFREKRCDIFIHDSLHEYGHMMWEYVSAFLNMETGGIIISDDIVKNRSVWWKFISVFRLPCFIDLANPNIGVTAIKLIES